MKRFVRVRTRNFTARPLRQSILVDNLAVVRLGSLTPTGRIFPTQRDVVEINTVDAIQNSRNKLLMKDCFAKLKIPQAEWWTFDKKLNTTDLPYPLVIKRIYGFQGRGMELVHNSEEMNNWISHHPNKEEWFIEKFFNGSREYRLHVAKGIGCFMTWRKLRTKEATERWFFNSVNSNWVGEEHELFDKPSNWLKLVKVATDCLEATGLDIGAVDIRIQSSKEENPKFIICEINSAPALGDYGITVYREIIKQLIKNKRNG
jgi:glutathione synthase/RimK-type ligase-like ATP-grasp enzyme